MGRIALAALIAAFAIISGPAMAQSADGYQAGVSDRASFEQWFGSLSGDYRNGAADWTMHRSVPKLAHCLGDGDQLQGCLAAQQRLSPFDARRRSEPSYRLGWNGAPQPAAAAGAVLPSSASTAVPLYHVQHNTYGCHNPRAALALTNPEEPRRSDQGWVNYVVTDGQCAPITPNSSWRMERREGDLAVMTYAGATGLPGTFYLRASELSAPIATAQDNSLGSQPAVPSSAYTPNSDQSSASRTYRAASPNNSYLNLPAADASSGRPQGAEPLTSASNPDMPHSASSGLVWILAFAGIAGLLMTILIARTRDKAAIARRQTAIAIAFDEINNKAHLLHVRREQLTQPDFYGTRDYGKWEKEKVTFIETRIIPLLNNTGMADLAIELMPAIFAQVEDAADRPIPVAMQQTFSNPEIFSTDMDPIHYEMHCALQLQKAGWITKATPRTGDQGADVLAERNGATLVVQCKLYSKNVGNGAVQEAVAARVFHRTNLAAVVSNAAFTKSARELAGMSDVALLHHSQLPAYTGRSGSIEVINAAD